MKFLGKENLDEIIEISKVKNDFNFQTSWWYNYFIITIISSNVPLNNKANKDNGMKWVAYVNLY